MGGIMRLSDPVESPFVSRSPLFCAERRQEGCRVLGVFIFSGPNNLKSLVRPVFRRTDRAFGEDK